MQLDAEDFRPVSLPPDGVKVGRGCYRSTNTRTHPVFWLMFNADPTRGADWEQDGRRNAYSESAWRREQWIDFLAGGGELVLRSTLERRWNDIVISDETWTADPSWSFGAGLDYGKTHPTAFTVMAVDHSGCKYAIAEHRHSQLTPATHTAAIRGMRLPVIENGIRPIALSKVKATYYDPSMGVENVAQTTGFTSVIKLFSSAGFTGLREGMRGQDLLLVEQILEAWEQPEVKFKIFCPKTVSTGTDGTYEQGCPNLLLELLNIRRVEHTATREQSVGAAERLVDKDNDSFDSLKYWWTANPSVPVESQDEKWRKRVAELRKQTPNLDLNSLVRYQAKFQREQPKAVHSWR